MVANNHAITARQKYLPIKHPKHAMVSTRHLIAGLSQRMWTHPACDNCSVNLSWPAGWHVPARVGQSGKIDKALFSPSPTAHFSAVMMLKSSATCSAYSWAFVTGLFTTISADLSIACSVILYSEDLLRRQALIVVSGMPRLIIAKYGLFLYSGNIKNLCFYRNRLL